MLGKQARICDAISCKLFVCPWCVVSSQLGEEELLEADVPQLIDLEICRTLALFAAHSEQTPTLFRRAGVFSYAGEFLSNERERVGFRISTPAESNRLRRNYRYLSLLHVVSPGHAIFLFYFSFFYILFYIFLCILNLVDGLLLVHSILGTQHEAQTRLPCFYITPHLQLC